ncbi:enoyl-CoA hydratase/isomerase family protein [Microbacterium sp. X-17]|uniref:enoyl-CoA hydratase/isomerase family protein n=1 Tax=Microbacterium sp. X-17 TaxID=3144404 RepID=UPI0031F5CE1B
MSVELDVVDRTATITINRPERMNALDEPTRVSLAELIRSCGSDPEVGAVVITGAGRAFCAGQDLAAIHELDDAHDTVARTYNPIAEAIATASVPVIAAVNGAAVGAGMGIALACDVVLMSESASLACVFGTVGLVPDTGTSWQLVRSVGYLRAFELAASGRRVGADEALALGLASELVAPEALLPRARELAADLARGPRLAQQLTKRLLRQAQVSSLAETLAEEAVSQGAAALDGEHLRRRAAFLAR